MASCFLVLHDASDLRIGGVSGQRKLCMGGSMLKWHKAMSALHLEKPLLRQQSTPVFRDCPSGDLLKPSECRHNQEENGSKTLPCLGNIAIA